MYIMDIHEKIERAADIILKANKVVALTGAGISVESGIPDFRGAQGLWEKYDPMEYATIDAFISNPAKVWGMLMEMHHIIRDAKPNPAHIGLAKMEEMGVLDLIITQNVDHLHQDAGNRRVVEFHGNNKYLVCMTCNNRFLRDDIVIEDLPPRCDCGGVLKPDVVFFGEAIPWKALIVAREESKRCNAMLVIGTSAVVAPACDMPVLAKENGAKIIEINKEETHLTNTISDIHLMGPAGQIVPALVDVISRKMAQK
jgi:NAD-dependent deacetylase